MNVRSRRTPILAVLTGWPVAGRKEAAMRRRRFFAGSATAIALAVASAAAGAPDNKNTTTFTAVCDGVPVLVTTIEQSNAAASFAGGDVAVVKRLSATVLVTFSVAGGPTLGPFPDPVEEGAKGGGFEDKLVECDFSATFTDTFKASKRFIDFFDLDPSLIGATVTVTGEISGTALLISPGS
jgi:hypothetical protein